MGMLWLGATGSRPSVELIDVEAGERLPLALPVDHSYAFDHAIARRGWVAVQVGYEVIALPDGDLLHPVRLPTAWRIAPAADPDLILLWPFREHDTDGPVPVSVVNAGGETLRSAEVPMFSSGEITSGLLASPQGLIGWDGSIEPMPASGQIVAVVASRFVVLQDGSVVRVFDVETGDEQTIEIGNDAYLIGGAFNADATRYAIHINWSKLLVITEDGRPRLFQPAIAPHTVIWTDDNHLAVVDDHTATWMIDIRTGEQTPITGLPRGTWPRIDVTGRFDPAQLRSVLSPKWRGPIPAEDRDAIIDAHRRQIRAAMVETGMPEEVASKAGLAVHLRSCIPPRRIPLGASRFGGRPDLPKGHRWPRIDGHPLTFIAQLRWDETVATFPVDTAFPRAGLVTVFTALPSEEGFDWDSDAVYIEVIGGTDLRRAAWPGSLPEELRYAPSLAVAEPMISLPDRFFLEQFATTEVVDAFELEFAPAGPLHQLFGYPKRLQNSGQKPGFKLFLQFDGDALVGSEFGDGGRIHIYVPADTTYAEGVIDGSVFEMECF
jgi:hypothetical protein